MSTAVIYNTSSAWSPFENTRPAVQYPAHSHQENTRSFSAAPHGARRNGPENNMDAQNMTHNQNSRSARMRRALNVPARTVAAPAAPPRSTYAPLDPWQVQQPEVIAEFGRKEQPVSYPFGSTALPPRLQTGNPRSRSRHDLPPRFRSNKPSAPRVCTPPETLWTPSSTLNSLAISFQPQLSPSQHLSALLSTNVSYSYGASSDTRPVPPTTPKSLEIPAMARILAPIGAERAQRMASTANVMPSNYTSSNISLASIGPPPGLRKPLPVTAPRKLPNMATSRFFHIARTPDVVTLDQRSEIEKIFKWRKLNKFSSRIVSPLNPLRNSDCWIASDAKWKREEREQRRQRVLFTCDTSVFKRKLSDHRSRM